jgi:GAF domain-containing protein
VVNGIDAPAETSPEGSDAAQRRLAVQYAIVSALAEAESLEDAGPRLLRSVCESMGWDLGAIWLLDRAAGVLRCVDLWAVDPERIPRFVRDTRTSTFKPGVGLPGRAWAATEPVWSRDVVNDPNFPRAASAARNGIHAAVAFPVMVGSETLGVLEFFSREVREPDLELLRMMVPTGSQIAQFIQRRQAEADREDLLRRERAARAEADLVNARLRRLQDITDVVMAHLSLDDLLRELLDAVRQALDTDTSTILLVTEDGRNLGVRAVSGDEEAAAGQIRVPIGKGIAGKVAARRQPAIVDDVPRAGPYGKFMRTKVKSLVAVPLEAGGEVIGVLHASTFRFRRFTQDDVHLLRLVGERAAVAIENARLYEAEQSARLAAESAAERTTRLQVVTAALSAGLAPEEIAETVIHQGLDALDGVAAAMALLSDDGRSVEIIHHTGYLEDFIERWRRTDIEADLPMSEAIRTRRPVVVGTAALGRSGYPDAEVTWPGMDLALVAVPMLFEDRAVGALVFRVAESRPFLNEDVEFLLALAGQSAQALERARLHDAEQRALSEAEAAQLRLAFLAEAGSLLAGSLKLEDALERLGRLAVDFLSDICLIDLMTDDDVIDRVVALHADPRKQPLADQLKERFAPDPRGPHPAVAVMQGGGSMFSTEMSDEFLRRTCRNEEHFQLTKQLGFQSFVAVPLLALGRPLGTLTLVSTNPERRYGPGDVALAEELARRAGQAVETARLYESEHEARHVAQRAASRTLVLQSVTAALSEAVTSIDVATVVMERALPVLGASAGSVVVLKDGKTLEVVKAQGYPEEVLARWRTFSIDDRLPLAEAVRTAEPVILVGHEALEPYDPAARAVAQSDGDRAWVAIPMVVEGGVVGALGINFRETGELGQDELGFMLALGRQCGQALERTRLYDSEQAARREAEAARSRLLFLTEASEVFSGSLDSEVVLENITKLVVPTLADWCVVDILEENGAIRQAALAHVKAGAEAMARELRKRYPPDPDLPHPVWRVLRTGEPELAEEITQEDLRVRAVDELHLKLLTEVGIRSHMVVPLRARGRTLGAVSFVSAGQLYGPDDLALAEELVARAALALDNARLYQQQLHAARALQRSLLPQGPPRIPGIEISAQYRAAGEGIEVGGDFYDVFETRDEAWMVVVGDVCGKGPEAAAVTGLARHTIRATALHEDRPSAVLGELNRAMLEQVTDGRFCTVCCARVRWNDGGARVTVSSGGHPLPLILRAGGEVETAAKPGRLLGLFEETHLSDQVVNLGPGDAIIMYTDGVTEEARQGVHFGMQRLRDALAASAGGTADAILDGIQRAVFGSGHPEPRDDVAIVVLRIPPVAAPG